MAVITEKTLLQDIKVIDTDIEIDTTSLVDQVGEVQAIPTANTVLDRLKTIATNTASLTSEFTLLNSTNLNTIKTNTDLLVVDSALQVISNQDTSDNTTSIALKMGEVQATPTANTQLGRLKDINDSLISLLRTVVYQGFGLVTLNTNPKLIVSANLLRKNVIIQAVTTNTGLCYLGYDNSVTNVKYLVELQAGDVYANDSYLGDFYISNTVATDKISYGEV